jgi:hypothetical protein
MSSQLRVRVTYVFLMQRCARYVRRRRLSAAELCSAGTGEGARPHTGTSAAELRSAWTGESARPHTGTSHTDTRIRALF